MRALGNLRLIGVALAFVVLGGTCGFHFLEGWPWYESFYIVLVTITTIGYSGAHPSNFAGRLLEIAVIIAGVGLVFLAIGALATSLLEFELQNFFGRRRMEREIGRLSGHYIICGAGRVGRSAARELARKPAPFVIIESSPDKASRFNDQSWLAILGDATQEDILRQARIESAIGLVAATTTDATNIYITLTARSLNPKLKIIARASEDGAEKHLKTAGADTVISPYHFAGTRIAQSLLRPHVLDFLDSATTHIGRELEIAEVKIPPASRFAGQTFRSSKMRHDLGVIVLAIKRGGEMRFNPGPDDGIESGDFLIAMGEPGALRRLEETAAAGRGF
ncbi:MAG TPA: potassium channel protein [Terriglobales bacterium]|nr:potassium channel protein [Terriglobales bacterium]